MNNVAPKIISLIPSNPDPNLTSLKKLPYNDLALSALLEEKKGKICGKNLIEILLSIIDLINSTIIPTIMNISTDLAVLKDHTNRSFSEINQNTSLHQEEINSLRDSAKIESFRKNQCKMVLIPQLQSFSDPRQFLLSQLPDAGNIPFTTKTYTNLKKQECILVTFMSPRDKRIFRQLIKKHKCKIQNSDYIPKQLKHAEAEAKSIGHGLQKQFKSITSYLIQLHQDGIQLNLFQDKTRKLSILIRKQGISDESINQIIETLSLSPEQIETIHQRLISIKSKFEENTDSTPSKSTTQSSPSVPQPQSKRDREEEDSNPSTPMKNPPKEQRTMKQPNTSFSSLLARDQGQMVQDN